MTSTEVIIFSISTLATFIASRVIVHFFYNKPHLPFYRKQGLNMHHFHWGLPLATLAGMLFLFDIFTQIAALLLGIGLAMSLDEYAPSLFLKTERKQELEAYYKALPHTTAIFILIFIVIILMAALA